jgi:hypothetical protein
MSDALSTTDIMCAKSTAESLGSHQRGAGKRVPQGIDAFEPAPDEPAPNRPKFFQSTTKCSGSLSGVTLETHIAYRDERPQNQPSGSLPERGGSGKAHSSRRALHVAGARSGSTKSRWLNGAAQLVPLALCSSYVGPRASRDITPLMLPVLPCRCSHATRAASPASNRREIASTESPWRSDFELADLLVMILADVFESPRGNRA